MPARGLHRLPTALSSWPGRALGAGVVAGLVVVVVLALGIPATAAGGPTFSVMNTSETPPDGVWFRDDPMVSAPRLNGYGVYRGDRVRLECYGWGPSLGTYANRLWYRSSNLTRPSAPGRGNVGWLNAHYVDDGQKSNVAAPGVPPCGAATSGGNVGPIQGGNVGPIQGGNVGPIQGGNVGPIQGSGSAPSRLIPGSSPRYPYGLKFNACTLSPDNPFGYTFKDACNRHDGCYVNRWSKDRAVCDTWFINDMNSACSKVAAWRKPGCYTSARTYWGVVRTLGWVYWNSKGRWY